jgi:hypothetical protein
MTTRMSIWRVVCLVLLGSWLGQAAAAVFGLQLRATDDSKLRTFRIYERCSEASRPPDLFSPFRDYSEVGVVGKWWTEVEVNRFYYFCVTAVSEEGAESGPSNMVFVIFAGAGTAGPVAQQNGLVARSTHSLPWLEWMNWE